MKLKTLERFLNKDQELWNREDMDKLIMKYGKTSIFYDTDGITNRLFMLFKFRDMSENDKNILDFIETRNKKYMYIINYLDKYIESIDFVFWPMETALQVIYKILCEQILSDEKIENITEEYIKLKQLARKISLIRYDWIIKTKGNIKGDLNESK